jgi:hypothetical protein
MQELDRLRRRAGAVGVVALGLCVVGALASPAQFFHSYLMGFLLWLGVALGCMAIAMLHHLSGGAWGQAIRPLLEAGTRTIPLMPILWLPLLLGLPTLYLWAQPEAVAADPLLQHKQVYLNVPFFLGRAAVYFAFWVGLALLLTRRGPARQGGEGDAAPRLRRVSTIGLIVYVLTATFSAIDWVMSLEPHWFSTMFGVLIIGGQGLGAFAFVVASTVFLFDRLPFARDMRPSDFHDLGNLILAFVMLWTYFAFSQFLIIWSGNLPEEIPWYVHRLDGGWQWIALSLVIFHFAIPFLLLLSRTTKRAARTLGVVALGLVAMRLVDLFWLIAPELHQEGLDVHWLDVMAPLGIGGIWLAVFTTQLATAEARRLGVAVAGDR